MDLTTYKQLIVQHCAENIWRLYTHWVPDEVVRGVIEIEDWDNPRTLSPKQICDMLNQDNWVLKDKTKASKYDYYIVEDIETGDIIAKPSAEGCIIYEFDNAAFDDMLRASVYVKDDKVVYVEARGE